MSVMSDEQKYSELIRRTELLEQKLDSQQKTLDTLLADLAELSRAQRRAGGRGPVYDRALQ